MASFLGNFFGKKDKHVVGIDVGSSSIKVVELYTNSGRVYLETYGSISLGSYADVEMGKATNLPEEKTGEALNKLLEDSGGVAKEAAVNIPFNSSLVSVISLPKISEKKLEQIVPTEARKYIPVSMDEVRLDWSVIGNKSGDSSNNNEEKIEVLLAAIHKDSLERYRKIMEKVSLNISFFEIEVFSTLRTLSSMNTKDPLVVVDIGASSTKIYIFENGVIRFSHTVNIGSQDLSLAISRAMNISEEEAEMVKRDIGMEGSYVHLQEAMDRVFERLFSDVLKVIQSYKRKSSSDLERVVISGGGGCLKGVSRVAQKHLDKSISVLNPFDRVKHPPFMKETLIQLGPEYVPAVGAALRGVGVYN